MTYVGGLAYLPPDTIVAEYEEKITNLENAHLGMNNFHNEPAHVKPLTAPVPNTCAIPDAIRGRYVKSVVRARIGNGYAVSWNAEPYHDALIARFREAEALEFVKLVRHSDSQVRLMNPNSAARFRQIADSLRPRVNSAHSQRVLDGILNATDAQIPTLGNTHEMKRALSELN